MKIIDDCWDWISAAECEFGGYSIEDSKVNVYIRDGLELTKDMEHLFSSHGKSHSVGHCILAFDGVEFFKLEIYPYERKFEKPTWTALIPIHYKGGIFNNVKKFHLAGGITGLEAYVFILIEAQKFSLHILDESERFI